MLNKVIIMGRLVRDPELRRTQSGNAVTTIRIAVERDFKNQDGTRQSDFFDVVAWQATAEFVSRYFTKGRMIVVEGRLQNREWQDRDGNKRVSTEIVTNNVYFGDSKRDGSEYGGAPAYGSAPGYGSGASGYGSAPSGYGAPSAGFGSGSAAGYSGGAASGYGTGSAPGYGSGSGYGSAPASPQSDFSEIADEDGDLPF